MNKYTRQDAIDALVAKWVHQDGPTLGTLKHLGSFEELTQDVAKLYHCGKSAKWKSGIDKWIETIVTAIGTFSTENGISSQDSMTNTSGEFSLQTGTEHARLLVWAVNQGSTYAAYAI